MIESINYYHNHSTLEINDAKNIIANHCVIYGSGNTILGNHNKFIGDNNISNGNHNKFNGNGNVSNGNHCQLFGNNNKANGSHNKLFGENNNATGSFNKINTECVKDPFDHPKLHKDEETKSHKRKLSVGIDLDEFSTSDVVFEDCTIGESIGDGCEFNLTINGKSIHIGKKANKKKSC